MYKSRIVLHVSLKRNIWGWQRKKYLPQKVPLTVGTAFFSLDIILLFLYVSHVILRVSKHKEDKLSVPASVTECVNDLVPDFIFFSVYLSVN